MLLLVTTVAADFVCTGDPAVMRTKLGTKYTEDNHSVYKTIQLCRNRRFRILPYKIDVYKRNNTTQYTIITLPLKLQHVNSMFSLNLFDKSLYENIAGE